MAENKRLKSRAAPPFMGEEIEWAVWFEADKGRHRLPDIWELETMINIFRAFLEYPQINDGGWEGALEETSDLKSEKEWSIFLEERGRLASRHDIGILPCGFRYYIDGAHLELSSPGCSNVKDLMISTKAAEQIMNISRSVMGKRFLPPRYKIRIFKDTSNRKGTSFAGHENYLINRDVFYEIMFGNIDVTMQLASFLASRIPLTGAGKVGAENRAPMTFFQISQRADWIERLIGLDTMVRRSLINMRDEPHSRRTIMEDVAIPLARLHIICGEPNMSPLSTKMRFGFTSNFLMGLQDGVFDEVRNDIILADPVRAMKIISRDLRCQKTVELADGRKVKFYEILRVINDRLRWYFENLRKPSSEQIEILNKVEYYCDCFAKGSKHYLQILLPELDWINRLDICLAAVEDNYDFSSFDVKTWRHLYFNDLCYADIDQEKSFYYLRERSYKEEGLVKDEVEQEQISDRVFNPPQDNREYLRGEILKRFPTARANWGMIHFPRFGAIDLSDPFRGGFSEIGNVVKECRDVVELFKILKDLCFDVRLWD